MSQVCVSAGVWQAQTGSGTETADVWWEPERSAALSVGAAYVKPLLGQDVFALVGSSISGVRQRLKGLVGNEVGFVEGPEVVRVITQYIHSRLLYSFWCKKSWNNYTLFLRAAADLFLSSVNVLTKWFIHSCSHYITKLLKCPSQFSKVRFWNALSSKQPKTKILCLLLQQHVVTCCYITVKGISPFF